MKKIIIAFLALYMTGCSYTNEDENIDKNININNEETINTNTKVSKRHSIYNLYEKGATRIERYEPKDEVYSGIYIKDKEENFIIDFEQYTNTHQNVYLEEISLTDSFPLSFALACYSSLKMPYITVTPPDDDIYNKRHIIRLAKEFGELHIPMFVNMYPLKEHMENSEEYIKFIQDASTYFEIYAQNVSFVWSVDYNMVYDMQKYYAGDSYIDWIGLDIYENIENDDKLNIMTNELDYIYKHFSYKKPIFINLGISHFSDSSYKYNIDSKINELNRYFKQIPYKYPKIKMINYISYDKFIDTNKDRQNYSITDNKKILKTYKYVLEDEIYAENTTYSKEDSAIENIKKDILAYKIGHTFYIESKYFKSEKDIKEVEIDNKKYYNLDDVLNIKNKKKEVDAKNKNIIIF